MYYCSKKCRANHWRTHQDFYNMMAARYVTVEENENLAKASKQREEGRKEEMEGYDELDKAPLITEQTPSKSREFDKTDKTSSYKLIMGTSRKKLEALDAVTEIRLSEEELAEQVLLEEKLAVTLALKNRMREKNGGSEALATSIHRSCPLQRRRGIPYGG